MTKPTEYDYTVARAHLRSARHSLVELLIHWDERDLPDDFLSGSTYPFSSDLSSLVAELDSAIEELGGQ